MIRELNEEDIARTARIWLETNITAHNFIPSQYWQSKFDMVKGMLLQSEVYVYKNEKKIQGFIGMDVEYILGIFVPQEVQSQGIGKLLLDFAKSRKEKLCLDVYQKNTRAVRFYQREGFEIRREGLDEDTGEEEYVMIWKRKKDIGIHAGDGGG